MFDQLLHAIPATFAMLSVLGMIGGTIIGIVIGALPGLNPVMGIALLLPMTYGMDPLVALALVAGIYNGSMYGGAIPAILLRIPGTPAAICTTFDGHPMAARGEAGKALKIACWSSAIGGMASAIALIALAPLLAKVTLAFGPAEYFWVAVFGLTSIALLLGSDPVKGLLATTLGLLVGAIGIDQVTGEPRYTFDSLYLLGGFELIVVLVGLYALPPVLQMAQDGATTGLSSAALKLANARMGFAALRAHGATWLRSSLIGIVVGILPGAGGNIAAFLSYNEAKRKSKDPASFGKGNPDGIAAAECGNNADNAAAMIPALTLGVPGNLVAALILGALMIHGLQPGPQLFRESPDVVFGFMIQMFVTSVLLFALGGLAATRVFAQVQRMPAVVLTPLILVLMVVGVYAINGRVVDLYVMLGFGLLGYVLERLEFPLAPVILGLLLGPMAEQNGRLALLIAQDDWTVFFTRPISLAIVVLIAAVVAVPVLRALRGRLRAQPVAAS